MTSLGCFSNCTTTTGYTTELLLAIGMFLKPVKYSYFSLIHLKGDIMANTKEIAEQFFDTYDTRDASKIVENVCFAMGF